jgi:hypothetical protein
LIERSTTKEVAMTKDRFSFGLAMAGTIAMSTLVFAGEPSGIGEKGTGQTKKSTERQQSGNKPDMSQVPQELREGQSAQAARELKANEQPDQRVIQGPSGIGEKGTGRTTQSTQRQEGTNQPDLSRVPQALEQGKSAGAAEQLSHGKQSGSESERQTFRRMESDQMAQGQDLVNEQREKRQ